MIRMTAIAIYLALAAWPGMSAHAQPASTTDAKPQQTQRAGEVVIRCAHQEGAVRGLQPCRVRQADEAMHLGSDVTRQEFECVMSGLCSVTDRGRVIH